MVEATIDAGANRDEPVKITSDGTVTAINGHERGDTESPRIGGFSEYQSPGELQFDTPAKSRRGRPKGSRNNPRPAEKAPTQNLIESFESLLLSVHFMAAKLLEVPELELDDTEAKRLSDALKKVAEFYPVGISPKRLAIAELCIATGTVYGPRIVTIYKKKPKQPGPVRVMPGKEPAPAPSQPRPAAAQQAPRVPSEMWNQNGDEVQTDQA